MVLAEEKLGIAFEIWTGMILMVQNQVLVDVASVAVGGEIEEIAEIAGIVGDSY